MFDTFSLDNVKEVYFLMFTHFPQIKGRQEQTVHIMRKESSGKEDKWSLLEVDNDRGKSGFDIIIYQDQSTKEALRYLNTNIEIKRDIKKNLIFKVIPEDGWAYDYDGMITFEFEEDSRGPYFGTPNTFIQQLEDLKENRKVIGETAYLKFVKRGEDMDSEKRMNSAAKIISEDLNTDKVSKERGEIMTPSNIEKITEENYYYASTHPYFQYSDGRFVPFTKESLEHVVSFTFEFNSILGQGKPVVFAVSHGDVRSVYHLIETGGLDANSSNLTNILNKHIDPDHWYFVEYDFENGYAVSLNARALTNDDFVEFLNENKIKKFNAFLETGYVYYYKRKVPIPNTNIKKEFEDVSKFVTSTLISQSYRINFNNGGISNITESGYRSSVMFDRKMVIPDKSTAVAIQDIEKIHFDGKICAGLALGVIDESSGEYFFGDCNQFERKIIRKWKKKILKAVLDGGGVAYFKEKNGDKITMHILNYFLDRGFDIIMIKRGPFNYYINLTWAKPSNEDGSISKGHCTYLDMNYPHKKDDEENELEEKEGKEN